ncbi:MAG: hypothetical protein B9S32_04165 [Verrucomicrobia bacterium Tous-C9LFEB]|nr:MAG: hypothetical protein B9S32_04165 [Verrucomicrobia bacterium Tous-C9LFEB]
MFHQPGKKNKIQKAYESIGKDYAWWWVDLPKTFQKIKKAPDPLKLNLSLSEKSFWEMFSQSAYLYELHKRKKGKYLFEKPWPEITTEQKTSLLDLKLVEEEPICREDHLRAYKAIRDDLILLLKQRRCISNQLFKSDDWDKVVAQIFKELDIAVDAEIKEKPDDQFRNWTAVHLRSYNLNQTRHQAMVAFTRWRDRQYKLICPNKPEKKDGTATNALKLFPRLEAFDLYYLENIQSSTLLSRHRSSLKLVQDDLTIVDMLKWPSPNYGQVHVTEHSCHA